ncbi:MAG: hypothetical protein P1U89_01035 [Verrucomicrobiales bacterium]|nr:hypothetical protein [Verrucomicrobiales bacterium]
MRGFWICFWLSALHLQAQDASVAPTVTSSEEVEFPTEFTTKTGEVYLDCKVKRIESDSLIIVHRGGIAKVSFFDVSEALQKKHNFDPVAAMEKYHRDQKIQKELKWQRFWKAQEYEANEAAKADRERFLGEVKATWIPIEAVIQKRSEGGAFVRAKRIAYIPTKEKSALGFEIDGPLRKTLVPIQPNVIFLETTGINSGYWKGYLEPVSNGTRPHPYANRDEVPSYRAVARTDFK